MCDPPRTGTSGSSGRVRALAASLEVNCTWAAVGKSSKHTVASRAPLPATRYLAFVTCGEGGNARQSDQLPPAALALRAPHGRAVITDFDLARIANS